MEPYSNLYKQTCPFEPLVPFLRQAQSARTGWRWSTEVIPATITVFHWHPPVVTTKRKYLHTGNRALHRHTDAGAPFLPLC